MLLLGHPIEDHARLVDVNLKGLIFGAHAALRQFTSQGYGTLINTSSVDSETPLALQNTYAKEEQPVGWKAKTGDLSHHLMPKVAERMSAKLSKAESEKASFMPDNTGAIYKSMDDGLRMDGGLRKRMKHEDEARA
jgi:NADP-dependent 3-hydroxy acid dehydrogenase YdfG